jgi:hypothetical protein
MLISESLSYLVDAALPCAAFFFLPERLVAGFVRRATGHATPKRKRKRQTGREVDSAEIHDQQTIRMQGPTDSEGKRPGRKG